MLTGNRPYIINLQGRALRQLDIDMVWPTGPEGKVVITCVRFGGEFADIYLLGDNGQRAEIRTVLLLRGE